MKRIAFLSVLVFVSLLGLRGLCGIALAGDPISPLYQARLDATLAEWEMAAMGAGSICEDNPDGVVMSAQPWSYCLGSLCAGSVCLGSACLASDCLGSGCIGSGCVGSGCVSSACVGSGCVGSICGGSACLGVTLCSRRCGGDGPPVPQSPDYPSSLPRNCPQP